MRQLRRLPGPLLVVLLHVACSSEPQTVEIRVYSPEGSESIMVESTVTARDSERPKVERHTTPYELSMAEVPFEARFKKLSGQGTFAVDVTVREGEREVRRTSATAADQAVVQVSKSGVQASGS